MSTNLLKSSTEMVSEDIVATYKKEPVFAESFMQTNKNFHGKHVSEKRNAD